MLEQGRLTRVGRYNHLAPTQAAVEYYKKAIISLELASMYGSKLDGCASGG